MTMSIQKQIAALDPAYMKRIKERFTFGDVVPYDYQVVMYGETAKRIANYEHPFYIKASVSAGKTVGFAMVAAQCQVMNLPMLILARQAEIVQQDSEELSNFGVKNSVYCAGLNTKSAYFPIVVGSEGSVANGLDKALSDFYPMVVGIDECHQVDWEDLAEAIENNESRELMSRAKDKPFMVNDHPVPEDYKPHDFDVVEYGTGRAQYTIIIMELMRRCRERYGRELRVFGMTGSEFRGVVPILVEDKKHRGFWREQVTDINTSYLVDFGSVVPTIFGGTDGLKYDLDEFKASGQDGTADFGSKEMKAMEKKIHESASLTKQIMTKVAAMAETRNAVLITCAGQRHCKEAAESLPPGSTYAIITEKTNAKKRQQILDDVRAGKIKYTFQVMALTTGVNVPNWDFSVILRKIGSLTLLIQLLGRGMRLLKKQQIEMGMVKNDHLVWDFAGTMDELGQLYFDPILEQYQYQRKGDRTKDQEKCPLCGTMNSGFARRCMHRDEHGNRCEYFWKSQICSDIVDKRTGAIIKKGCGTENDVVARVCRCCDATLIDPNKNLSGKMYTKNDWCDVLDFKVGMTKSQTGILYHYRLRDAVGVEFDAVEKFFPESDNKICKTLWRTKGVTPHVVGKDNRNLLGLTKNAVKIMSMKHLILAPSRVTHRKNGKGEDIISRKDFGGEIDN
ncbi:DNA helicase [Enterobacter phage Ec_L1]|uniref:DNA helicase n=1 Tax=Enterobacter phage Ec_L1 TaxID=2070180 RepID=A0A2P0W9T4_9CAUD|nr:DNA helicase [Enterobacter phage Ec_L1]AUV57115.1 DNA helicase [Enterobacter phage Ec_L1]